MRVTKIKLIRYCNYFIVIAAKPNMFITVEMREKYRKNP